MFDKAVLRQYARVSTLIWSLATVIFLVGYLLLHTGQHRQHWNAQSPNKVIAVQIECDDAGGLNYSLWKHDTLLIRSEPLIATSETLRWIKKRSWKSYQVVPRPDNINATTPQQYCAINLTFQKGDTTTLGISMKLYNDSLSIRCQSDTGASAWKTLVLSGAALTLRTSFSLNP